MEILSSDKYMIFSDDLEWCKSEFVGDQFHFSEERDPVKDLGNFISCSNHIIANSSFSWWGAWLSPYKDKKVIAPRNWFGPKLAPTHNTKDLLPPNWIVI
ncbi:alpha-1,2-fucosyltransferase, partial [Clostridium perfringens]